MGPFESPELLVKMVLTVGIWFQEKAGTVSPNLNCWNVGLKKAGTVCIDLNCWHVVP